MAFTRTPDNNTYQTKYMDLFQEVNNRFSSDSFDNYFQNCYVEFLYNEKTEERKYEVVKRPGIGSYGVAISQTVDSRGLFYWEDQNKVYYAAEDSILVYNATTGALLTTLSSVWSTTTGHVGFTLFDFADGTVKVVASDGVDLITIDSSNTVVTGADVDMPTPHLPYPIAIDGYLILVDATNGDICNSELENPLSWVAGDFIRAEMNPDEIQRPAKLNNYLVIFGTSSIEYFYNAAIDTGSPFQRNDAIMKPVGYVSGFAEIGNNIFFVGKAQSGELDVYQLMDVKMTTIGTPSLRRKLITSPSYGAIVGFNGHTFYALSYVNQKTAMYDLSTKVWSSLLFGNIASSAIKDSVLVRVSGAYRTVMLVPLINSLVYFDDTLYQDMGTNFIVELRTPNEIFGTYNQKFMNRLIIHGDQTAETSAPILVSWSDDDYKTFTTARTVEMNQELPSLTRLGRFRRRAFKLSLTANTSMRLRLLELELNMGAH